MSRLILILFVFLAAIPVFAQKRGTLPTSRDKATIVKSILERSDLLNRGLSAGETADKLNLSLENISPNLVPKVQGVSFLLFNRQQIRQRVKTGFLYYKFGSFKVLGKKVQISFGHYFENQEGQASYSGGLVYEFKKVRGRWIGSEIDGWGSISLNTYFRNNQSTPQIMRYSRNRACH